MTQAATGETRSTRGRFVTLSVVVVAIAALVVFVLYARGGGPVPGWLSWMSADEQGLLEESEAQEALLRTLRLAGFDHAVVGEEAGTVVVRLEIPYVRTPADAELSWQTAVGAASGAYPDAELYVAQLFALGDPLIEARVDGDELRDLLAVVETAEFDEDWDLASEVKALAEIVYLTGAAADGDG